MGCNRCAVGKKRNGTMGKTLNLSAVIVFDSNNTESKSFKRCLDSINFADEIVKVDSSKIPGSFSEWREAGLKLSKGKWIFYLDTDEEVTKELKAEILKVTNGSVSNKYSYAIPRKNIIFGKEFKYSGQYPDYQKRLFLKSYLKGWAGKVHEEPIYVGELGYFKNPIIHHKDMTISQMIEKTNKWSEIEADLMFKAKHPPMNFFRFFTAGLREFNLRFIKQLSFLDGKEGVIYGIYQIYSRLISYSKLWEKQLSTIHT